MTLNIYMKTVVNFKCHLYEAFWVCSEVLHIKWQTRFLGTVPGTQFTEEYFRYC
jgi:hypothetical protein